MKKISLLAGYSRREKKDVIFALCLLAFPIIQFIVFYLFVNLNTAILAFQDIKGDFTLANFERLFKLLSEKGSNSLSMSLARSLITFSVGTFITFPVSIFITYALFKKIPGEMFFRITFFLPSLLGQVIMTTMYRYIVDATGPVLKLVQMLNINVDAHVLRDGLLGNIKTAFPTILVFGFLVEFRGKL